MTQHDYKVHRLIVLETLSLISLLIPLIQKWTVQRLNSLLLVPLAFEDATSPWSSQAISNKANDVRREILAKQSPSMISEALTTILREQIKSAFTTTPRNSAITEQARKAISPLPVDISVRHNLENEDRPWKTKDVYVPTVLHSIIKLLDTLEV